MALEVLLVRVFLYFCSMLVTLGCCVGCIPIVCWQHLGVLFHELCIPIGVVSL